MAAASSPPAIELRVSCSWVNRGWSTGSNDIDVNRTEVRMNAFWRSAATLAILAAVTPTAAMAQGPRPSGSGAAGFVNVPVDPATAKIVPHYEWQYHYAGRHAHWEGHWVLVKPPIAAAGTPGAGGKL